MVAPSKRMKLDPESEFIQLLKEAAAGSTVIEADGERFRVIRETSDLFADYDADLAVAALGNACGNGTASWPGAGNEQFR